MDTNAAVFEGVDYPDVADVREWDSEKLLDWLQSKAALGKPDGPSCRNFAAADVTGLGFLLSDFEEFRSQHGVSYIHAKVLAAMPLRSRVRPPASAGYAQPARSK